VLLIVVKNENMEKKRCYKNEKLKKEKAKEALKGETLVNKILRTKRAEKKS